ncbi:PREDICTED: placenta-specific gene 8 protein [Lepidothrix coronata]|uniref:Placenta-specific gene 8 protein n=1 Tax=Lepidothrix coronata TaxID=321398 RepID=A0A6J0HNK8_9PASS|nr:PREDICTED: placenta-specific gene 8 protein [Lepidothrix coronata]
MAQSADLWRAAPWCSSFCRVPAGKEACSYRGCSSEEHLGMASQTIVTIQPQYGMPAASRCIWQTGLMDCCSDCGVCCCGMFCFPCLACQVAGDMNECCLCGTSVAMRTLYRTRYNIPVSG